LAPVDERERASGLSLSQIETFLALVEEGSMSRASRRLGLGRSTLSAHIKTLGEEFGQRLFVRVHDRMTLTPTGIEAYGQLRPLTVRAGYCLAYFRSEAANPPTQINAVMPVGFPGALIDEAVCSIGRTVVGHSPATWVSPIYGSRQQADKDALNFSFGGLAAPSESSEFVTRLRDRWVVVRAGPTGGWQQEPVRLSEFAHSTIIVPKLPEAQLAVLLSLSEKAQAQITFTTLEPHEIFAQALQNQQFLLMMPAGLLNPALVSQHLACALLEESELDPAILITSREGGRLPADIGARFARLLTALSSGQDLGSLAAETDRISLKYCRSFLALFEERNVRRAAQRLCIVQPALTVQLHGLEALLETPLFVRSHRGLQPNARAETLYSLLAPLMAQFSFAVRSLREPRGGRSRHLRLGLIPALDAESETAEYFADALDSWSSKHPDVIVQVLEAYSGTLLQWLSAGRIDFALIDRIVDDPEVAVETIAEDRMAVVVDSSAEMLPPGPVRLEEVTKLPLVVPSSRHGLRSILLPRFRKAGLDLKPRIEVDSMAAAISLVMMGRYATILPFGAICKSRERRRLSIHEICEPQILRSICLVQLRKEMSDRATQDFISELRLAFSHAGEMNDELSNKASTGHTLLQIPKRPLLPTARLRLPTKII
jgi:DNA-binding transcriptional LysR family regulator